jgi:hypothetical protein
MMNALNQMTTRVNSNLEKPLYASPWLALFFLLRNELIQSNSRG